jgi:hypothetical protein
MNEYLGSIFQEKVSYNLENEKRISETRRVMTMLNGIETIYTQQSQ